MLVVIHCLVTILIPSVQHDGTSLTFTTYTSQRGKQCITVDDCNFRQGREYDTYTLWTCMVDKCPVTCKTMPSGMVSVTGRHIHLPKKPQNIRRNLRKEILKLADTRKDSKPSSVVEDAIRGYDEYFDQTHVESYRKAVTMHRLTEVRNNHTLPKNIDEVFSALEAAKETSNLSGADMIKGIDQTNGIAMFYSDRNLDLLRDHSWQVFGDGTFTYCSAYFCQMYTLHLYIHGYYIPVVHFLLPDKFGDTYIRMFRMLKHACAKRGFHFDVEYFSVDLEPGTEKAIKSEFPNAKIRYCSFHVGQAWKNQMFGKKFQLKTLYNNTKSSAGLLLRKIHGLKSLDEDQVSPCFYEVFLNKNTPKRLVPFFKYIEKYYIAPGCKYPITRWANLTSMRIENSTNGTESFHAMFAERFHKSHPNIYLFMSALSKVEVEAERKSRSRQNPRKNQTVKHTELLVSLRRKAISYVDFLKVASPAAARVENNIGNTLVRRSRRTIMARRPRFRKARNSLTISSRRDPPVLRPRK